MWSKVVKPGTKIISMGQPRLPLPLPLPPQAPPVVSDRPIPPNAKRLEHASDIYTADGPYMLPFDGCDQRVHTFRPVDVMAALGQLEIYEKLRVRAPQKRWANLDGDVLRSGSVREMDDPEICLGQGIAKIPELQGQSTRWYVDILEGEVMRTFREKDETAHLNGDSVFQWDRYASSNLQEIGRQKHLRAGLSIVASWVEFVMGEQHVGLIGQKLVDKQGREFFAVVGWKTSLSSKCIEY